MTTHHFEGIDEAESIPTDIADAVERYERALDALVRLPRHDYVDECIRELLDERSNLFGSVAIFRDADADRPETSSAPANTSGPDGVEGTTLLPTETMPTATGIVLAVGFSALIWAVMLALFVASSR